MDLNEIKEDWQKDAPRLAAMEKKNPYTVPDAYFEEMESQLLSRIKISEADNNQHLFTVPEGYFDALPDQIISLAKFDELKQAKDIEVFSVPENYFLDLEDRIITKIGTEAEEHAKPKVKRLVPSWATYAAAACLTAIISFGIYYNNIGKNDVETQIAALPAEEIVGYLQLYSDAGDGPALIESLKNESDLSEIGSNVSEQEIEQYLELNM